MIKILKITTACLLFVFIVTGCATLKFNKNGNILNGTDPVVETPNDGETISGEEEPTVPEDNADDIDSTDNKEAVTDKEEDLQEIDYNEIKPDESGKIMVVMFHNFIKEYESGDKLYTMTFKQFEDLLEKLYELDYRLISLSDYINNTIDLPAGCIPIIFTFDDASKGQFNLIKDGDEIIVNPESAVGIMEKFNRENPDFGLEGTFFVNFGQNIFPGEGDTEKRLRYLLDRGFEIGNHTLNHANLANLKQPDELQKQIGGNNNKLMEIIPGYEMEHLSLPYGAIPSESLREYIYRGEYKNVAYENRAVLKVGASPAPSPVSSKYNPLLLQRVRAPGIVAVDADLDWWLDILSREQQYISDGKPGIISIPQSREPIVSPDHIMGFELVVY